MFFKSRRIEVEKGKKHKCSLIFCENFDSCRSCLYFIFIPLKIIKEVFLCGVVCSYLFSGTGMHVGNLQISSFFKFGVFAFITSKTVFLNLSTNLNLDLSSYFQPSSVSDEGKVHAVKFGFKCEKE